MVHSMKQHGHFIANTASDCWALGEFYVKLFRIQWAIGSGQNAKLCVNDASQVRFSHHIFFDCCFAENFSW